MAEKAQIRSEEKENIFNVPNFLSATRICLIPVFLVMVVQQKALGAFIIFLVAAITDLMDGITARLWHQKTRLGAYLDPIADKLLMTSAFVALSFPTSSFSYSIPVWLSAVVIGRDLFIVFFAFLLYKLHGQRKFNPTIYGKFCTASQMGILILVLLLNVYKTSFPYLHWLYLLTLLLTLFSGVHYAYSHLNQTILARRNSAKRA
jgi:cardiolipin synthase